MLGCWSSRSREISRSAVLGMPSSSTSNLILCSPENKEARKKNNQDMYNTLKMSQHTAPRVILLFSSTLVLLMQRRLHVVFDGRVIPGRLAQVCIMYFVVARPSSVHDVHSCTTSNDDTRTLGMARRISRGRSVHLKRVGAYVNPFSLPSPRCALTRSSTQTRLSRKKRGENGSTFFIFHV